MAVSPKQNATLRQFLRHLRPWHHHWVLDFNTGSGILHTLLQTRRHRLYILPEDVYRNSGKSIRIRSSSSSCVLGFDRQTKGKKIRHRAVSLLVLDASYTDQENDFQDMHEQETQNVVVLHLARRTGLHNWPNEKQPATRNCQAYLCRETEVNKKDSKMIFMYVWRVSCWAVQKLHKTRTVRIT